MALSFERERWKRRWKGGADHEFNIVLVLNLNATLFVSCRLSFGSHLKGKSVVLAFFNSFFLNRKACFVCGLVCV